MHKKIIQFDSFICSGVLVDNLFRITLISLFKRKIPKINKTCL